MGFNFENLDESIRTLMLEEVDLDIQNGRLYLSPRLNHHGQSKYPEILKNSIKKGNEQTLSSELSYENYWNSKEQRRTRKGITYCKVPVNANETLAEGEFNRFYIRAICKKAIDNDLEIEIYRAKSVKNARTQSQIIIGQKRNPSKVLEDLRTNIGFDTVLGLPPGPNSGLSVRIIDNPM